MFKTYSDLENQARNIIDLSETEPSILDKNAFRGSFIDSLVETAVFAEDEFLQQKTRALIKKLALQMGAKSESIYPLYMAFGKGEVTGFTIPAINVRTLTYDTARLIFRLMMKHSIGVVIFEIARSEIEYTHQRPDEYSSVVLAAAIKEGYQGPIFLQGDHYQFSKNKFTLNKDEEIQRIKDLVRESLEAQFYNIDIDASTLVDLSQSDVTKQQRHNVEMTAAITNFIRSGEPENKTISIGGEIGHIGGKNSTVEDFKAFMEGYKQIIPERGLSKISVQTGSSHGGTVLPDGTIQKVAIDFNVLKEIGTAARSKYQIGGAVQHGASTLPIELFDDFVNSSTLEIHLATGFQNIVLDNLPEDLKQEMEKYILENFQAEKEEGWNDKQFIYKLRKKALGPFKQMLWELSSDEKKPIVEALEKQFILIFSKLNIINTREITNRFFS